MSELVVVCPSRGRPQQCIEMAQSVMDTSDADLVVLIDDDDQTADGYKYLPPGRTRLLAAPPRGKGPIVNFFIVYDEKYRIYLVVPDDCKFTKKGWDKRIIEEMNAFGDDIGVVHLSHQKNNGDTDTLCNFPAVSRTWVQALGWYNQPAFRWSCQDTIIQILGDALDRITMIEPAYVKHIVELNVHMMDKFKYDQDNFFWYCVTDFKKDLDKLRSKMEVRHDHRKAGKAVADKVPLRTTA
jgi:hypothetical protein